MNTIIVWLRNDLRVTDNPALHEAAQHAERVLPLYLYAPDEAAPWQPGAASRWWLHHSLKALDKELKALGSRLILRRGDSREALLELARQSGAGAVYWNRRYEPALAAADDDVAAALGEAGVQVRTFAGSLLFEPQAVATGSGGPYKVFTPYWKACRRLGLDASPLPAPKPLPPTGRSAAGSVSALDLLPRVRWDQGLGQAWTPGAAGAARRLEHFLDQALPGYPEHRDRPDLQGTSRLSPHLHFGEISPRQVVAAVQALADRHAGAAAGAEALLRELGWREFAHHVLHHFPHTTEQPMDPRFERFPWRRGYKQDLQAWQRGRTGIPVVDAGMRELWHTGWMHNRVRMLAASLLTKSLRIPWQEGARWFWDTLVDADLANNTMGWQWTAGSGADAAPYFRIFNPVTQGERFDPRGDYVRRWVPELAGLPAKWIHRPWEAPAQVLREAGVALDAGGHRPGIANLRQSAEQRAGTYPEPVVDLKSSRERALEAFGEIKAQAGR